MNPLRHVGLLALVLCAAAASPVAQVAPALGHRASGHHAIGPKKAIDFNPRAGVFETVLVAFPRNLRLRSGNRTQVYTYNGLLPGPTIEAAVGDKLIVHFFNYLPESTTIHWHGQDLPANQDGSNIAQLPVPPRSYFRYEFDLLRAGTFWYHPHISTNEQVEKGLSGALIVQDPAANRSLGLPHREHVLVLDDVLLDADNQIAEPFPADPLANAETHVNGRTGNLLLVNGRNLPRAALRRDVPHRMRIVNTSNSRFMRVSFAGHTVWRIGGDGGLLEQPIAVPPIGLIPDPSNPSRMISDPDPNKGILLTPAERADVIVEPTGQGPLLLEWHDWARGRHEAFYQPGGAIGLRHFHDDGKAPPETLMTFRLFGRAMGGGYQPPANLRTITRVNTAGAVTIPVMFGHTPPDTAGNITFFAQMVAGMGTPFAQLTAADAPSVQVGDTGVWEVNNMTMGDHNFHTHGFHYQLIETEFVDMDNPANNYTVPAAYLEWKDTILIPRRPGAQGRSRTIVRLAASFDDTGREGQITAEGKVPTATESGGWVFHCHILEHADRGMMSFLQVK